MATIFIKEQFEPYVKNSVACGLTQARNEYWSYIHHLQVGDVLDNDEMKSQLKLWKKQKVVCLKSNFKTYKFFDKTFYYFVIQAPEGDMPFDPIGMFCKDINGTIFLVSGYGYICRQEENREKIWNYLGAKQ